MDRTGVDKCDSVIIRTAAAFDGLTRGSTDTRSGLWIDDEYVHHVLVCGLEARPGSRVHSYRLSYSDESVCLRSVPVSGLISNCRIVTTEHIRADELRSTDISCTSHIRSHDVQLICR